MAIDELFQDMICQMGEARAKYENDLAVRVFGSIEAMKREFEVSPLTLVDYWDAEGPQPARIPPYEPGQPITVTQKLPRLALQLFCRAHNCETVSLPIMTAEDLAMQKDLYVKGELPGMCCFYEMKRKVNG